MRVGAKISLMILAALAATIVVFSIIIGVKLKVNAEADIARFTVEQKENLKKTLKSYSDIVFVQIETSYKAANDKESIVKTYGHRLKSVVDMASSLSLENMRLAQSGAFAMEEAQKRSMTSIKSMRYDNGIGYVWIQDLGKPTPRMLMHPASPGLDGKLADMPVFTCAVEGTKRNLLAAFVEFAEASPTNDAFVQYLWPKPTKDGLTSEQPKLSYVKTLKEWGWLFGTGIYIDDVMSDAKTNALTQIKDLRYDEGKGYFWINDLGKPVPKMLMHPLSPALDGKVVDDPKYNCVGEGRKNLFATSVEVCETGEGGFIEYPWPKDVNDASKGDGMKMSYVRLFKPYGWVVGTGVFVDKFIETPVATKRAELASQFKSILMTFAVSGIILLTCITLLTRFALKVWLTDALNGITESLQEGSARLALISGQVSDSSQSIAGGVSQQAASIEETSESVERMSSMTRLNAENSSKAKDMATNAMKSAKKGSESMTLMSKAIDDIKKSSDSTAKIVKTIDEIAFQTNLLALNAAVEAARAGEAGKGFAVVAGEVRSLAQRSAEAAKHTAGMIEESVRNADNGVEISRRTAESLNEISLAAKQVKDLLEEIAIASNQQSQGIAQIGTAISEIEKVTQANSAGTEKAANASVELSAQAEEMKRIVIELLALVGGEVAASAGDDGDPGKRIARVRSKAIAAADDED